MAGRLRSPLERAARRDRDGADVTPLLEETLGYARERDYRGPDYADGMSSRLLRALPVESAWLNLAVQESVKRAPIDLRPLFRVEERRNYKGISLFAMANMNAADLARERGGAGAAAPEASDSSASATATPGANADANEREAPNADAYGADARSLAEWLLDERIDGYAGFCGGHRHALQTLDGVVPTGTPGVVGTSYAVKALLRADERYDGDYASVARSAADFVFEDLGYEAADVGARIDYKPAEPDDYDTVNAVALGARLLIDLYDRFEAERLREGATELLRWVAARQTDAGGWYYRDPPDASHLSMDNHHNGFVIEAFQRYRAVTGSERFDRVLDRGLTFYRETLFEDDGAPNFDEEGPYPRDIHAATQGVLVFAYAGDDEFARRIVDWTVDEFYAGDGRFYFRKYRYHTKRVVLMRWAVGWMAYALSELQRARAFDPDDPRRVG